MVAHVPPPIFMESPTVSLAGLPRLRFRPVAASLLVARNSPHFSQAESSLRLMAFSRKARSRHRANRLTTLEIAGTRVRALIVEHIPLHSSEADLHFRPLNTRPETVYVRGKGSAHFAPFFGRHYDMRPCVASTWCTKILSRLGLILLGPLS
jgi:hypothetical protein